MSGRQAAIDFSREDGNDRNRVPKGMGTTVRTNVTAGFQTIDANGGVAFHEIVTNRFTIGRSPSCNLTINDTKISRKHTGIVQTSAGFYIEDLDSSNGTIVNGKKVEGRMQLETNDEIRIGQQCLVFKYSLSK